MNEADDKLSEALANYHQVYGRWPARILVGRSAWRALGGRTRVTVEKLPPGWGVGPRQTFTNGRPDIRTSPQCVDIEVQPSGHVGEDSIVLPPPAGALVEIQVGECECPAG